MRHVLFAILLGVTGSAAAAQERAEEQVPAARGTSGTSPQAGATLNDAAGRVVGEARLEETPHGVLMTLELTNATPGIHGLHVHETGRCDPPSFESAGGHFNPRGHEHGFRNERGPHIGDLPNIHVPNNRQLSLEVMIQGTTLAAGERSLLDSDGSAIVMHAGQDDYRTDPAGDAGERLACGVILR